MSGCPDANALAQLADATLDGRDREAIEQHLDGCAACTELVRELAWSLAPERESPPGFRITGRAADGRYEAVAAGGERVDLRLVPDHATPDALVGVSLPHVVPVRSIVLAGTDRWIATAPTTPLRVLDRVACSALVAGAGELHRRGIMHGAITRGSLRRDDRGAVLLDPIGPARPPARYLAPERLHGGAPSRAADQFGLCVALWEAMVGEPPFSGETPGALAVAMQAPVRVPRHPAAPVLRALARGLAFEPGRRWPEVDALGAALGSSRRGWQIALAVAALAAIAVIAATC